MNSAELQKLNLKSMSEAVCQISISLQTSRFSSSSSGNGDLPQLLGSSVKDTGTLESSHHGAMHSDRIRSQIFLLPDGPDTRSTASALPGTILCFKTAGRSNHEILTQTRSGAYYYLPQDSITSNLYIYIFMPHFFPYLSLSLSREPNFYLTSKTLQSNHYASHHFRSRYPLSRPPCLRQGHS